MGEGGEREREIEETKIVFFVFARMFSFSFFVADERKTRNTQKHSQKKRDKSSLNAEVQGG